MGPFYCPNDEKLYIDLSFFRDLQQRFRAPGDFAQAYVIAHEVGHHVQKLRGKMQQIETARGGSQSNEMSVRLELQADCYAGVWVGDANRRGLLDSPTEIQEAIKAAEAVGDDRIQQATTGRVDPETWTHGSAAQRHQAFMTGFDSIDPKACTLNG
jgi:predicted metalloprotease